MIKFLVDVSTSQARNGSGKSKAAKGRRSTKAVSVPKATMDRVERGLQYLSFLLSTESSAAGAPQEAAYHHQLVVPLLVEVGANPTGPFVRLFCKTVASIVPAGTAVDPRVSAAAVALVADCEAVRACVGVPCLCGCACLRRGVVARLATH